MTDPIADMLSRIRNALRLHRPEVELPYSNMKYSIAKILEHEGWIASVEKRSSRPESLRILLKYEDDGTPFIRELRRISTPSRRVYVGKRKIPIVLSNLGVAILSTPAGMMTNAEARKRGIGGEVVCEIS